MMSRDHETELPPNPDDQELPPTLAAAVERARALRPASEQVVELVARMSELGQPAATITPRRSVSRRWTAYLVVAATSVLLVIVVSRQFRPHPKLPEREIVVVPAVPVTPQNVVVSESIVSEVTTVSLVAASFAQVEDDIREAESQVALATEAIAMAEVRRELQMTLTDYPRWGR